MDEAAAQVRHPDTVRHASAGQVAFRRTVGSAVALADVQAAPGAFDPRVNVTLRETSEIFIVRREVGNRKRRTEVHALRFVRLKVELKAEART